MIKKDNKLANEYFQRPLSNREKAWPRVVTGVVFFIFSWYLYVNPQIPPFTGRSRWLSDLMYTHLGVNGMPVGFAVLGVLSILWGIYHTGIFEHRNTP